MLNENTIHRITMASLLCLGVNVTIQAKSRPNVVIFLADDTCYDDLEIYGSQNTSTPHLKALASEGMQFSNCYQAVALSSPTRHSLYTGIYPVRSGAYPNHTFVNDDVQSFVQYFGDAGYLTALYGKQHVAPVSIFSYDYLGDYQNGNMDFGAIEEYIAKSGEQPLFMVVASHEAHGPYDCGNPEKWALEDIVLPEYFIDTPATRRQYRQYLAEVEVLDSEVGRVRDILERQGKSENTIFIFLSEQGNSFAFSKWTCYSQGLRSGMVVSYPGHVEKGSHSQALVEYIDVLPTVLDICKVKYKKSDLDGRSFKDVLWQKRDEHKDLVYGLLCSTGVIAGPQYYGIRTVSNKDYRYIRNLMPDVEYFNAVTQSSYWREWQAEADSGNLFAAHQIERYTKRPAEELYDIKSDPYELRNLADNAEYSSVLEYMREALAAWMLDQGDQGVETEKAGVDRLMDYAVKGYRKRFGNK